MLSSNMRRIFWYFNKYFMVPAFRLGFGPLINNPVTGYVMVLKTTGRKSGQVRYAPVNYAILNGNVYCLAGWGDTADWYRNAIATPRISAILPGNMLSGVAEEVRAPGERLLAMRQVLKAGGFAGFMLGFNPHTASEAELSHKTRDIPVIRVTPTGIASGPSDAGGWLWLLPLAAMVLLLRPRKRHR